MDVPIIETYKSTPVSGVPNITYNKTFKILYFPLIEKTRNIYIKKYFIILINKIVSL